MSEIASHITSLTIVYSTVYPGAVQSKHQSSASLAFVWGIHRGPVNSPHKWLVTRKMFPFDDVIMRLPLKQQWITCMGNWVIWIHQLLLLGMWWFIRAGIKLIRVRKRGPKNWWYSHSKSKNKKIACIFQGICFTLRIPSLDLGRI